MREKNTEKCTQRMEKEKRPINLNVELIQLKLRNE